MAPLPFQFLCALGRDGILCASRGDRLYIFGADCALIAEHSLGGSPATAPEDSLKKGEKEEKERNQAPQDGPSEATSQAQETEEVNESATPPPKRRKVDSSVADVSAAQPAGGDDETQAANGGAQKKRKAEKPAEATERSYVILLKATGDGSHVVAVTGGNKTVHVLEHNGKGHLTRLSQR